MHTRCLIVRHMIDLNRRTVHASLDTGLSLSLLTLFVDSDTDGDKGNFEEDTSPLVSHVLLSLENRV